MLLIFTSCWQSQAYGIHIEAKGLINLSANIAKCVFHLKSFVILTQRYLILSTFSRNSLQSIWSIHHFDPFPCYLHHIAFLGSKHIQSSAKCFISESVSVEIPLMYKENNKWPRTLPCGTPDNTGAQSDFAPFPEMINNLSAPEKYECWLFPAQWQWFSIPVVFLCYMIQSYFAK